MSSRSQLKELKKEHELIERYIRSDNHRSAMIYIDKILSQHPNEFKTLVYRSKCEMAEELYTEAEDTLTLAMDLQPEKPLPALAFVSLSEKFEVNGDKLFLALQIMRNFAMASNDEVKYQLYSLKMLKLSVKLGKNIDFIRELANEIEDLPADVKFDMLISFYERDPDILYHQEAVFLFEYLGVQISTFSGNIDSDGVSLKLYKVFCDLGYKTNNISRLFDLSNSVFQNNSEAWALHGELLNLALLEFWSKAAEILDVPQIEGNTVDMLRKLADMPDTEGSVKPTIRGVASVLVFLLANPNGALLEKVNFESQMKLSLSKLVTAYSLHNDDPLIGILILFLLVRLRQPLHSTLAKVQSIRPKITSFKKFSQDLREKLLFLIDYLEVLHLKSVSLKFNADEIIRRCDLLLCRSSDKGKIEFWSENIEEFMKDERLKKVCFIRGQAVTEHDNEVAHDLSKVLESIKVEDNVTHLLKAWVNHHAKYSDDRVTLFHIEAGLGLKPDDIDLLLFKAHVSLMKLIAAEENSKAEKNNETSAELELVLPLIEKCEQIDPFACEVCYLYSLYYYLQGFLIETGQCAMQCYSMNKMHLDSIKFHCRIFFESANYESCIATYRSRLIHFPSEVQFKAWLKLAVELYRENQPDLAMHCIAQCRVFDRNNYRSWLLISVIFYKTNSFHSALSCSLQTVKLLQQDAEFIVNDYKNDVDLKVAAFLAASCRLKLKKYLKASCDFSTLAVIDPNFLLGLCEHIESLTGLSRSTGAKINKSSNFEYFHSAISLSFECVRLFPRSAFAWKTMADTLLHSCDIDKDQMVQIPGLVLSKNSRSIRVQKDTLMHMAYHTYCYVIYQKGFYSSLAWLQLSRCCYFIGGRKFLSKSVQYARIAVSLDSENDSLWLYLGCLCASDRIKMYELAQTSFLMAHKMNEDDLTALGYLGFLYVKTQKRVKAGKIFEYIGAHEPSNVLYLLFKQINQANTKANDEEKGAVQSVSPGFVIGSLESLETKPLDNQMVMCARALLEEAEEGLHGSGVSNSDVYYKVLNHLLVAASKSTCQWDFQFVLGCLFSKVSSTQLALQCFSQASNYMNREQIKHLSSVVLKTIAATSVKDSSLKIREVELKTLFDSSSITEGDKANLCISLWAHRFNLYEKYLKSLRSDVFDGKQSEEGRPNSSSGLYKIMKLMDDDTEIKGAVTSQQLQKLYFSTLDSKYLVKLCLQLFPQLSPSQLQHFILKLQHSDTKDALKEACIVNCNVAASMERNDSQETVAFAQKLVHRYPWIPINWPILVYTLTFAANEDSAKEQLKDVIESNMGVVLEGISNN